MTLAFNEEDRDVIAKYIAPGTPAVVSLDRSWDSLSLSPRNVATLAGEQTAALDLEGKQ